MRTMSDAHLAILFRVLDRALHGLPTRIEQVDCELCEDNRTVAALVYFGDGDHDAHAVSWDLPQPIPESDFDAEQTRRELLRLDDLGFQRDRRRIAAMLREAAA